MTTAQQRQGNTAEKKAADYLAAQGLNLLQQNFQCKCGEIDLIMQDQEQLVFIEVRYRDSSHYGGALHSITPSKQKKIRNTASFYLLKHKLTHKACCRFDVVAIDEDEIMWIKSAFQ